MEVLLYSVILGMWGLDHELHNARQLSMAVSVLTVLWISLVSHALYGNVDEFKSVLHREAGTVKPVLIILDPMKILGIVKPSLLVQIFCI